VELVRFADGGQDDGAHKGQLPAWKAQK
jgi:hypothetical protein